MCEAEFGSDLDVAIVIHSLFMKEVVRKDGTRVNVRYCKCAVWRSGSDSVREAPFHFKSVDQVTELLKCPEQVGTTLERISCLTDRCGKQYNGHRKFRYISKFIVSIR